ncbi:MAG: elongation factor 4 [Acidobacteria bacterium]|nr:MAG: elongation factor 4 [Acidobacteriota bacterium]
MRNFSIIAHIDHGKSTLADRLLEKTGALSKREMTDQVLDSMDLERERGITIKAHAVRLLYRARDGCEYQLHLIDTPGHVDFSYEVSRSLAACEGALLVIDASQGVEAQTLANAQLALNNKLTIIPVINKIDLPGAEVEATKEQIEHALALDPSEALLISAKQGTGIDEVLESIVARIPPPRGAPDSPLQALVFDSWFDSYRGVVVLTRVVQGTLCVGTRIRLWSNGQVYTVEELGVLTPKPVRVESLQAGEVGFAIANIKRVSDTRIGDTITDDERPAAGPLPGFEEIKPMVFAGLYPIEAGEYEPLRDALEKLRLNDSSFFYDPENSVALGFGFRCGFLGLLHIESPAKFPPAGEIARIDEPIITALILTQDGHLGGILKLLEEKRGVQKGFEYVSPKRVLLTYELPLNEIVLDFYDRLKSISRGYASLDYHFSGYWESDLVKVDLLVAGEPVDALSFICHRDHAYFRARALCEKMRKLIPRQLFEVAVQASIGSKVIARENVPPVRKNVLAKCYGGDITRKRKLLEKQKEGKKRMKRVGRVDIPQEAFLAVLKLND